MSYIVQDENGERWYVDEGDPGWEACQAVAAHGFKHIVLPADTILHGRKHRPEELITTLLKFQQAYASTHDEDIRAAFKLYVRLLDCLLVLK